MFYDQFIKLCKERGVSPAAVTKEIGLNNSSSTAWKRGSIPKGDTLQKLADYFGVSVDYLLGKLNDGGKNSIIVFGSELEKIFESESRRLSIPVETLKMEFLKREHDGSRLILNYENISFYFDSIYGQNRKPENRVLSALNKLNLSGQQKAVERVEELTEIPRYRAETAPQPPAASQEGIDTTPPPDAPETPPEGE